MVSLVIFDILQLPHTVISNSEKLTHPSEQPCLVRLGMYHVLHFFMKLRKLGLYRTIY